MAGVLPGLGPVAGVALILPLAFSLDPTAGPIMMAGIFYGSMYGGSTTAILLNIPGESASVVTTIDGYQLARKGRAGATLTIVAVGSFLGGTLAAVGVMLFSSLLAKVAILFGPDAFSSREPISTSLENAIALRAAPRGVRRVACPSRLACLPGDRHRLPRSP
jgi:putative tricarboxylic transport membrane protein